MTTKKKKEKEREWRKGEKRRKKEEEGGEESISTVRKIRHIQKNNNKKAQSILKQSATHPTDFFSLYMKYFIINKIYKS